MGRVLVFGSINTDFVTYVDSLPAPGETAVGGRFQSFPGGKGANQAVAAARAGATVEMFGCIGDDSHGQERTRNLEDAGVSTRGITIKKGQHSGIAQIIVDAGGRNLIAVASGANHLYTPDDITLPENPGGESIIALFQNEIPQPTTEAMIQECKRHKMLVLWNTAPACKNKPSKETLQSVDYLICNQAELRSLVGDGDDDDILAVGLLGWGAGAVIVTLGEKGALLVSAKGSYHQAAFPVKPVDTVGAGDCFCGVFAGALSFGMSAQESLKRAAAAAALSVTRKGAQTSMPTASEIDSFLGSSERQS